MHERRHTFPRHSSSCIGASRGGHLTYIASRHSTPNCHSEQDRRYCGGSCFHEGVNDGSQFTQSPGIAMQPSCHSPTLSSSRASRGTTSPHATLLAVNPLTVIPSKAGVVAEEVVRSQLSMPPPTLAQPWCCHACFRGMNVVCRGPALAGSISCPNVRIQSTRQCGAGDGWLKPSPGDAGLCLNWQPSLTNSCDQLPPLHFGRSE